MLTFYSFLIELVKTPGRKKAALKKSNHLQNANSTSLEEKNASISSTDTFHSIPLCSPGDHIQQIETFPPIEINNQFEVSTAPIETFSQTDEVPIEIPTAPASQLLHDRDRVLTDIQEEDVEMSVKLIDKPIPPSFPTLPEPIPLRKSTKPPRDPSINAVLLGTATPGAPVGGMRTSWLMKAREANIDRLSKKSHPPGMSSEVGASSSLTFQGTKRKSDHFSLPQVGIQDDERPPKLAKTSDGETRKSNPFSLPQNEIRVDEQSPEFAKTSEGEKKKSDPFSLPQAEIRDDERPPKLAKTLEGETRRNDPFYLPQVQVGIRDDERPPKFAKTLEDETKKSDPFSLPQVGIRDDERPPKLAKTSEGEMESQSQPPVMVESAPEGVFDRLKKVVEDLGIHVGK
jgi:hypothetical protein